MQFTEIVYNPAFTSAVVKYLTTGENQETMESEAKKMQGSGTLPHILYYQVMTVVMMQHAIGNCDITNSTCLQRFKNIMNLVDPEQTETLTLQSFSLLVTSKLAMQAKS